MGGNGPHSGKRNSSFALATLPPDRFAGLSSSGNGAATAAPLSKPVTVTGKTMIMTLDVSAGGSVAVTIVSGGAPFATSTPLKANGTDAALTFSKDLAPLVGKQVQLQLAVSNAVVYTVGFRA